jgi:signal peptidase II
MKAISRSGWLAYGLALGVIALDQLTKYWVVDVFRLEERGRVDLLGPLRLNMVWNPGVAFGMLKLPPEVGRWGFSVFSIAVAAGLAVWARRLEQRLTGLAVGLIMGGALGNVVDRVRFGEVADFIDLTALHFPWVFNVADSAINVGVGLLILEALLAPRKAAA